ncbi:hypothetical protein BMF94_5817 [Rhodotorula taiwanensis]|uniref:Protein kinase domain-containing protein n=1 Tax=Rhodotorula taiwanensis TaxID=741276 RepID=A0A2S5B3Y9_9BASI|nr:hypothetical protein BMF94_5817 [Rhodotorula taiwanensis]
MDAHATRRQSLFARISGFTPFGPRRNSVESREEDPLRPLRRFSIRSRRISAHGRMTATDAPKLKRSRSAKDSVQARRRTRSRPIRTPSDEASPSAAGMGTYRSRSALFAMSSPDLATPASEISDWLVLTPALQTADAPVQDAQTGEEDEEMLSLGPKLARARSPTTKWEPPMIPPSPQPILERQQPPPWDASLAESARRLACRAEALSRLTTPTPTSGGFGELSAFPFPHVPNSACLGHSPGDETIERVVGAEQAGAQHARLHEGTTSLILPLAAHELASAGATSPPRLHRANTVGLHPDLVPLDIDLRGRLVRARYAPSDRPSPGLTISSMSSSSTAASSQSDGGSETASTSSPSIGEWRQSSLEGLWSGSSKRASASAVDVLSIVEEDAPSMSPTRLRPRTSLSSRRPASSSAALPLPSHPSGPNGARVEANEGLAGPRVRRGDGPASIAPPRPLRPFRLGLTQRSFSSGIITEPTVAEREELCFPCLDAPDLMVTTPSPALSRGMPAAPIPPHRAEKRFLSDPALEPVTRDEVQLRSPAHRQKRRNSTSGTSPGSEELEDHPVSSDLTRRASSSAAMRTKLVVRERGRPVLTFQLGECIGRGQFGSVYRALNMNTGQVVAVKRIGLDGKSASDITQLSKEVTLLQTLSHPAVVSYEGVVRTEHYLNIILEFVENGSLQRTLKQFGELPESLVASYVVKILEGLAYLHAQGVVHCDLKAANVLSTKNGNIKLSDFGVSLNLNAIKTTRGLAQGVHEVNGTPNWMAPEVISMEGALPASDIWSLGATICELVSGAPPYHDLVAMSAMFRIVEDEIPPLPTNASPELNAMLHRCFRKLPSERPTAEELFDDPWLRKHAASAAVRKADAAQGTGSLD